MYAQSLVRLSHVQHLDENTRAGYHIAVHRLNTLSALLEGRHLKVREMDLVRELKSWLGSNKPKKWRSDYLSELE
jgi:hypothetical protein